MRIPPLTHHLRDRHFVSPHLLVNLSANKPTNTMKILSILLAMFALLAVSLFAQDAEAIPKAIPVAEAYGGGDEVAPNVALDFFKALTADHAWLATLIVIMGALRAVAKPLFSLIHSIIDVTPSTWDNGVVSRITNFFLLNPVGKTIAYVLDWLTSIKIKPPTK